MLHFRLFHLIDKIENINKQYFKIRQFMLLTTIAKNLLYLEMC